MQRVLCCTGKRGENKSQDNDSQKNWPGVFRSKIFRGLRERHANNRNEEEKK